MPDNTRGKEKPMENHYPEWVVEVASHLETVLHSPEIPPDLREWYIRDVAQLLAVLTKVKPRD